MSKGRKNGANRQMKPPAEQEGGLSCAQAKELMAADGAETTVSFFRGAQRNLWLVAVFVSLTILIAGTVLGLSIPVRGEAEHNMTLNIIFFVAAIAGFGVFCVCMLSFKVRTSKWRANSSGVTYWAYGCKLMTLSWEEMKEVGFLKIVNPKSGFTGYHIYWAKNELSAERRNLMKNGVLERKPDCLGRYNCRAGDFILYAMDPNSPASDPFLTFMQKYSPYAMKNAKILDMAIEAASE